MRYQPLLFSSLFMIPIAIPLPAQAQSRLELRQAFTLAQRSIDLCYEKKDLEECRRLERIQFTLLNWCNRGDRQACIVGNNVQGLINIEFRRQVAKEAYE